MEKDKKHPFVNIMLFLTVVSSIINFVTTFIYRENDLNILLVTINILLLFIFTIFFVAASITNNNTNKATTFISAFILTIYNVLGILTNTSLVEVPTLNKVIDFRGNSLTSVVKWASKNNITLNQEYEYSDMIDEYKIISQDILPGSNIKNIKSITVSVSEGASPNKEVVVPDMTTWDSSRVLEFIKTNHLTNVDVEFIESDKVKDTVIEQSKSGNMRRSDEIKITFSLGEDELSDTKLTNLVNKSEFETIFYLKQHKINYEIKKDFSNKIKRGNTSKQSIKPGTMVKVNNEEKLIITISKGKKIKVPNLKDMSITEITNWIVINRLKLEFTDRYDDKVKDNKVIEVNYKPGDVIEQGSKVSLVISKGKLTMPKFESLADFYEWADKYSINYEEKHEFNNSVKTGEVISYSVKAGKAIKNGETIIITISDGNEALVPDLVDLTKSEAIKKLKEANLNYNFIYRNSNSIKKDKVISQSISASSKVSENTTITVTLSNGKKETESTTQNRKTNTNNYSNTNTSSSSNNSGSSNSNNQNTTPTPSTPVCNVCSFRASQITSTLQQYSTYESAANGLRSYLQSKCSGLKVNISGVEADGFDPGDYISGYKGGDISSCDTISITLAK